MKEFNALIKRHRSGQDWLNYRAALICSVLANTVRDPKKKVKPFIPDDFMPEKKREIQTPEQILTAVQMLNTAYGGVVLEV